MLDASSFSQEENKVYKNQAYQAEGVHRKLIVGRPLAVTTNTR
jgi:hypothetical protein